MATVSKVEFRRLIVALHNLSEWSTGPHRIGNPYGHDPVRRARRLLSRYVDGDGYDLPSLAEVMDRATGTASAAPVRLRRDPHAAPIWFLDVDDAAEWLATWTPSHVQIMTAPDVWASLTTPAEVAGVADQCASRRIEWPEEDARAAILAAMKQGRANR